MRNFANDGMRMVSDLVADRAIVVVTSVIMVMKRDHENGEGKANQKQ